MTEPTRPADSTQPDLIALLGDRVQLDSRAVTRAEAIDAVGALLVGSGAVAPSFVARLHEREAQVSTYVGAGVALPHVTAEAGEVVADAIAVVRIPGGVVWDGEVTHVAVGVAAGPGTRVAVLAELARVVLDPERSRLLRSATGVADVRRALAPDAGDATGTAVTSSAPRREP